MFYLLAAVRAELRAAGWFGPARAEPNLAGLLDLVALGTVADVVTLDHNNRILVEQGLRRIRAGQGCPGVRALLAVAGRDPERVCARDLGFAAGPRLNAAGRLTEMSLGVECLLTDDPGLAMDLARRLDALNRERRDIEGGMREQAEAICEGLRLGAAGAGLPPALCLYGKDWHQGVAGIVAARIRERYQRPVIALADAGDGRLRGSARSVEGVNIRDLIDARGQGPPRAHRALRRARHGRRADPAGRRAGRLRGGLRCGGQRPSWGTGPRCGSWSPTANWPRAASPWTRPSPCAPPGPGARASRSRCSTVTSRSSIGASSGSGT